MSRWDVVQFEYQIRDLKIENSKKDKTIKEVEMELSKFKEELDSYGIKFYAVQWERDLLKLKSERYEKLLIEKGILTKVEIQK